MSERPGVNEQPGVAERPGVKERPGVAWTARVLTAGTATSAVLLVAAFALTIFDVDAQAALLSTAAVTVLLATPAAGLIATYIELRRSQPAAAWLAVAVLTVLAVASVIALLTRT